MQYQLFFQSHFEQYHHIYTKHILKLSIRKKVTDDFMKSLTLDQYCINVIQIVLFLLGYAMQIIQRNKNTV